MSFGRTTAVLFLGAALALGGCGDDDDDDDTTAMDDMGGGGTEAPVITMVEWTQADPCAPGTASDVTVTVTVTDADTDAADLTFDGSVTNCTGTIDGATATVSCPQAAPYASTVTVTDPDGNSDTATFTIGVCEDGSVSP